VSDHVLLISVDGEDGVGVSAAEALCIRLQYDIEDVVLGYSSWLASWWSCWGEAAIIPLSVVLKLVGLWPSRTFLNCILRSFSKAKGESPIVCSTKVDSAFLEQEEDDCIFRCSASEASRIRRVI
jgi:hypothetical protein